MNLSPLEEWCMRDFEKSLRGLNFYRMKCGKYNLGKK